MILFRRPDDTQAINSNMVVRTSQGAFLLRRCAIPRITARLSCVKCHKRYEIHMRAGLLPHGHGENETIVSRPHRTSFSPRRTTPRHSAAPAGTPQTLSAPSPARDAHTRYNTWRRHKNACHQEAHVLSTSGSARSKFSMTASHQKFMLPTTGK